MQLRIYFMTKKIRKVGALICSTEQVNNLQKNRLLSANHEGLILSVVIYKLAKLKSGTPQVFQEMLLLIVQHVPGMSGKLQTIL